MGRAIVAGGKPAMEAPSAGILASELAVGSTVKLMENGSPAEYLVVHQGLPSSMYDSSCNGTWLLRKTVYTTQVWSDSNNSYSSSNANSYLNNTFLPLLSTEVQNGIKQVKIPYRASSGYSSTVSSGSSGFSTKIFLLSGAELGWSSSNSSIFIDDGAKLSYFTSGTSTAANNKRVVSSYTWWTRSVAVESYSNCGIINVTTTGTYSGERRNYTSSFGIRPAMILNSETLFDEETLLLKRVA